MKQYSRSRAQITLKASLGIEFIRAFDCFYLKKNILPWHVPQKAPQFFFFWKFVLFAGAKVAIIAGSIAVFVFVSPDFGRLSCQQNIFYEQKTVVVFWGHGSMGGQTFFGERGGSDMFQIFFSFPQSKRKKKKLDDNLFKGHETKLKTNNFI